MRPIPAGGASAMLTARSLCVAIAASIWLSSPALATTGPSGTDTSQSEYVLVLDPQQSPVEIAQRLTDAGFASMAEVPGVPPRFSNYRLIRVASADAQTKAALLNVDGIRVVRPVYRVSGADHPFLPIGQVIAKFKPGTAVHQVREVAARHGCTIARQIAGLPQTYVFDVTDESAHDPNTVSNGMALEPTIVYTHADLLIELEKHQVGAGIEDPLYPWQWHLNNTGQLEGAVPDADIDAPEAWTITMGENAVVGVIDDSIQRTHEDIADNYSTGYDFRDQDSDPSPSLYYDAHGVATSGIICARANSIGVRGVAPLARLVGCRLGGDFYVTFQDVADAFLFCEKKGAMAVNNSWGPVVIDWLPTIPPGTFILPNVASDAINQIATTGRGGRGVLVLFSSGNSAIPVNFDSYFAAMPTTMAIGATLQDDKLTCYSSFGDDQSVVAPGSGADFIPGCYEQSIATTDVQSGLIDPVTGVPIFGYNPAMRQVTDPYGGNPVLLPDPYALEDFIDTGYTRRFNGTSAACPVATGVAALVFSVNPSLFAREVRNIIEHTADKVETEGSYDAVTGHNYWMGHGRVNAFQAVAAAANSQSWPGPVTSIETRDTVQSRVRLSWKNPDWDSDGVADEEVVGVLVVQGPRDNLRWRPTDGVQYLVGQEVATGITVVGNDLVEELELTDVPTGSFDYALFVRNDANFYSWGRRASASSQQPGTSGLSASVRANPTVGRIPLTVQFAGGVVTSGASGFLNYAWNFADGAAGAGAETEHTYTTAGTYLVTLTVTNGSGQGGQATVRIEVSGGPNRAPLANIVATPSRGATPLAVVFDGSGSSDLDGAIVGYRWNFGDSTTATGAVVEHVYLYPRVYVATLTVTDDEGDTGSTVATVTGTAASADSGLPIPIECGAGAPAAAVAGLAVLGLLAFIRRR